VQLSDIDLTDMDRFQAAFPHEWFTYLRHEAPVWFHPPTDPAEQVAVAQDFITHRPRAHAFDERLDDAKVDVGFEQRQPDFPERRIHGRLGQPGFSPKGFEDALEPGAE